MKTKILKIEGVSLKKVYGLTIFGKFIPLWTSRELINDEYVEPDWTNKEKKK